jgi:hypothetical protein
LTSFAALQRRAARDNDFGRRWYRDHDIIFIEPSIATSMGELAATLRSNCARYISASHDKLDSLFIGVKPS